MAILKIISHGKSGKSARNVLSYILDTKKTEPGLCGLIGDFECHTVAPADIYRDFQRVRNLFGKEEGSGRVTTHGTVSWAPGEITHEEAAAFAREFLERIYPKQQVVYAVHCDTDHIHFHYVANAVSYLDGAMLHWSKHDLEKAKKVCNEMCAERGLSIAQKGRHQDGSLFDSGEITVWSKDKYHQIVSDPKRSYLIDAAMSIQGAISHSSSKEAFCTCMEKEYGWSVVWSDSKKHITFIDANGHRVRDSNLSKTFNMDISKEGILDDLYRSRLRKQEANTSGVTAADGGAEADHFTIGSREHGSAQRDTESATSQRQGTAGAGGKKPRGR